MTGDIFIRGGWTTTSATTGKRRILAAIFIFATKALIYFNKLEVSK